MPADTETRLARFTELVATAIADAQARVELRGFAEEQAALRRVATLVARAAPPEEVFAVVAAEAGQLLGADFTVMSRYDPDGAATVVGISARTGTTRVFPVGFRLRFGRAKRAHAGVPDRPARGGSTTTPGPRRRRRRGAPRDGFRSAVGVPISVEDRLWGVMAWRPPRKSRSRRTPRSGWPPSPS